MTDPVIGSAAQTAVEHTVQEEAAKTPGAADAADQARFENAMNDGPSGDQVPSPSDAPPQNAPQVAPATPGNPPSVGDAVLEGLEKMKTSYDAKVDSVNEQFAGLKEGSLSVQEAIRLQFELTQLSFQTEMTGKVSDKTSQGVQSLFRNQ